MSYISRGSIHETIMKDGKVVRDMVANTYSEKDKTQNNFIVQGRENNTPFLITNMKGLFKGKSRKSLKMKNRRSRRKTGKKSSRSKK